ncbi:Hypothetical protein CINCED_3A010713 [Cinara cedri]|uniref:Uncharacterized protein n=1 Tax=Cinara cedri TaxID=506608 RepID=A0A5E4N7J4_9HEMI|nr:Hypothetical protein CINCED_3A010713 [Cinara cedri]
MNVTQCFEYAAPTKVQLYKRVPSSHIPKAESADGNRNPQRDRTHYAEHIRYEFIRV